MPEKPNYSKQNGSIISKRPFPQVFSVALEFLDSFKKTISATGSSVDSPTLKSCGFLKIDELLTLFRV